MTATGKPQKSYQPHDAAASLTVEGHRVKSVEHERPAKSAKLTCARCGRRLRKDRYVFSHHSRKRYCWPGTGCNR